ncbi:hypothetical protein OG897_25015 [Streptomyces sp. NBC_00237]|uniref:hypothetical protein n=1 Tax=Streptomyces sp. NBC_00237 TaxID=2975687 RepID=UPI0022548EAF|nr:hypothetical protein [Streptomyces sp. NBC_00237]MCX5204703.1 hypothetical protein [Streptomyces sp. NBC_00237]
MAHADDFARPGSGGRSGGTSGTGNEGAQLPNPRSPFSTAKPRSRFHFRFTPVNVLLVTLGLLIGIGTAWFVQDPATAPAPLPAPTQNSTPRATPAPPKPTPPPSPTLPADFAVIRDPSDVTLAVPSGWRRDVAASVYYRSPTSPYSRFLQFWPLAESRMSATRALRVTVATHRHYPGFELQALHPTTKGAAELVYSYDSTRTGRRLTLIQRVFPAPDGKRYAFAVVGPAEEWPRQRTTLETALRHFEPVGE